MVTERGGKMSKLKLTDLIELAKQGYTPDKVKELIELSNDEEDQPTETTSEETAPETTAKEEKKEADSSPDAVDYKKKVEELEKKLSESESKLSQLQKENTRRNADTDDKKSDADIFAAAMKSFM